MEAIRIDRTGGPEVLQLREIAKPTPGSGEVLVKISAAGVNFIDIYHRTGAYSRELPFTPGLEAAGIVEALGPGVTGIEPGDRVAYSSQIGAYAQYSLVPAEKLVPVPAEVELTQAAAAMLQGMTAHYLTHSTYPLQPEHTCLIHAAAGGTGQMVVQMAKIRGATVIGTTSTREKANLAREAGADQVILYSEQDFEAETMRLTNGRGVDVVYDSVGAATFDKGLNVLRLRGMMVLFGQASGKVPPVDLQTLNARGSLFVTRPSLFHHIAEREDLLQRAGDLLDLLGTGKLSVRIDHELPLSQAEEAHRLLANRKSAGKILLVP
jgi:NADPH2:quinone reductase